MLAEQPSDSPVVKNVIPSLRIPWWRAWVRGHRARAPWPHRSANWRWELSIPHSSRTKGGAYGEGVSRTLVHGGGTDGIAGSIAGSFAASHDASTRLAIMRPMAAIQPPRARTAMARQDVMLSDFVRLNAEVSAIVSVMAP